MGTMTSAALPNPTDHGRVEESSQEKASVEGEFSVLGLLTILARRKRFLLAVSFGSALVLGGIGFGLKPVYTASVLVIPPQQGSSSGAAALAQLSVLGQGGLGLKSPVDMYVALMGGNNVLDAMIKRFDLAREYGAKHQFETRATLQSKVEIEANPKDGLIRLSLTDKDPARAAELANGYIEEFRKLSATLAISEAAQRRLFFEQQLEREKDRLSAAEEDLKRTEQTTGLVALDSQARTMIQSTANLRAEIASKEVQIAATSTYATTENPDLIVLNRELSELKSELVRTSGESGNQDLNVSSKLPQAGLEYVRKDREVKYQEMLFEILARQYESARLDEAKEGTPLQIADPATPPDHKSGPKRLYYILTGFGLGLSFGIVFVLFQAALERNAEMAMRYRMFKRALLG